MKLLFTVSLCLFCSMVWAQVIGEVTRVTGSDITLERAGQKTPVVAGQELNLNDQISTGQGVAQLLIYPATQMNLGARSSVVLSEHALTGDETSGESRTLVKMLQGEVRILLGKWGKTQDLKVEADTAVFGVRGTEFDLEMLAEGTDLEVYEGQVEVSDEGESIGVVKPSESIRLVKKLRRERRRLEKRQFRKKARRLEFINASSLKEKRERMLNRLRERTDRREERGGRSRAERRARRKSE